MQELRQQ